MEGYVSSGNSRYVRTLEEVFNMLEQTAPSTLDGEPSGKPAVNYLRLGESNGESAQPLEEGDYRRAIKQEFYNGSGFPALEVAQIDAAIKAKQPGELTVIITDLYQKDQYANQVVDDIRAQIETIPQGAVGIMGIRSEFNGTVYTEALRGAIAFDYNAADHPFYVMLLGRVDEVAFYMETLRQRLSSVGFDSGVEEIVFSPERLHKTIPTFTKQERAAFPSDMQSSIQVPAHKMAYGRLIRINLKDDAIQPLMLKKAVTLPFNLSLAPIENVFHPETLNINLSQNHQSFDASSKKFAAKDNPSLEEAVTIQSAALTQENINFSLTINPDDLSPPSIYFYTLDAEVDSSAANSSDLSETWDTWSSDASDPTTNTDGSRTHNLDDLLEGLADMSLLKMRQDTIPLGQYCYLIQPS